jgi:hypothetical protein
MPCSLSDDALHILDIVLTDFSSSDDHSCHSKKMKTYFRIRYSQRGRRVEDKKINKYFKNGVQELQNRGYLTEKCKNPPKYYINNKKMALTALDAHGFDVAQGIMKKLL